MVPRIKEFSLSCSCFCHSTAKSLSSPEVSSESQFGDKKKLTIFRGPQTAFSYNINRFAFNPESISPFNQPRRDLLSSPWDAFLPADSIRHVQNFLWNPRSFIFSLLIGTPSNITEKCKVNEENSGTLLTRGDASLIIHLLLISAIPEYHKKWILQTAWRECCRNEKLTKNCIRHQSRSLLSNFLCCIRVPTSVKDTDSLQEKLNCVVSNLAVLINTTASLDFSINNSNDESSSRAETSVEVGFNLLMDLMIEIIERLSNEYDTDGIVVLTQFNQSVGSLLAKCAYVETPISEYPNVVFLNDTTAATLGLIALFLNFNALSSLTDASNSDLLQHHQSVIVQCISQSFKGIESFLRILYLHVFNSSQDQPKPRNNLWHSLLMVKAQSIADVVNEYCRGTFEIVSLLHSRTVKQGDSMHERYQLVQQIASVLSLGFNLVTNLMDHSIPLRYREEESLSEQLLSIVKLRSALSKSTKPDLLHISPTLMKCVHSINKDVMEKLLENSAYPNDPDLATKLMPELVWIATLSRWPQFNVKRLLDPIKIHDGLEHWIKCGVSLNDHVTESIIQGKSRSS